MYQVPPNPVLADIQKLHQQQVPESLILDYKRDSYGGADEDKRKFLKDVAGMANANGGHIVIGINAPNSIPTELLGIQNAGREIERLVSIGRTSIEPRLYGFEASEITTAGASYVVLFIPRSPYGPHMITFGGLNQYWKRVGTSNQPMSTAEIREHCMRTETLRSRLEEFLEKQWKYAHAPAGKRMVYVGVTPIGLSDDAIDTFATDIRDLMREMKAPRTDGTFDRTDLSEVIPTLEGAESRHNWEHSGALRVFRTGHVDYLYELNDATDLMSAGEVEVGREVEHKQPFWPHAPVMKMLEVLRTAKDIHDRGKIVTPVAIQYGFIGVTDLTCPSAWKGLHSRMVKLYRRADPDIRIQMQLDSGWNAGSTGKLIADRVWNAFNWDECQFVTKDGKLRV